MKANNWERVTATIIVLVCRSLIYSGNAFEQYVPEQVTRIDCGSASGTIAVDGIGNFGPDNDTNVVNQGYNMEATDFTALNFSRGLNDILKSARVFEEPSSYQISILAPGSYWLRLYFDYMAVQNSNAVSSFFSVTVGQSTNSGTGAYSILKDFCPYSQAIVGDEAAYIYYEYYLKIQSSDLFITFSPSNGDSYAFINAQEIVSAPNDLIGENIAVIPSNGMTNNNYVSANYSSAALQTIYRVNIGGADSGRANDSTLSRAWETDSPYLVTFHSQTILEEISADKIDYEHSLVPKYFAPPSIYSSARESSPRDAYTNLTWSFEVEGFYKYLVRLHFCEITLKLAGERVFDIFINGKLSYKHFDIVHSANGRKIPVVLDFEVEQTNDAFIHLDLGQVRNSDIKMYAILNGIEILKVINLDPAAKVLPLASKTETSPDTGSSSTTSPSPADSANNAATLVSNFFGAFITLLFTCIVFINY